ARWIGSCRTSRRHRGSGPRAALPADGDTMVTSTLPDTDLPPVPGPQFPMTERQERILCLADSLAEIAARNASRHDREGTFPHETFAEIVRAGYHTLTIPEDQGGMGASPLE